MTPDDLATLHARAMKVPAPWTARDFAGLLALPGVFLVTPDPVIGPEISRGARGAAPLAHRDGEVGATPSGFALGRVAVDEAELLTLAVDPDARRRGLGARCLAAFEAEAARRGAAQAFLEVAATNAPALALYRAAGWTEDGLRRAYYAGGAARIDAVLMSRRLTSA